jgi:hypothetical protein
MRHFFAASHIAIVPEKIGCDDFFALSHDNSSPPAIIQQGFF